MQEINITIQALLGFENLLGNSDLAWTWKDRTGGEAESSFIREYSILKRNVAQATYFIHRYSSLVRKRLASSIVDLIAEVLTPLDIDPWVNLVLSWTSDRIEKEGSGVMEEIESLSFQVEQLSNKIDYCIETFLNKLIADQVYSLPKEKSFSSNAQQLFESHHLDYQAAYQDARKILLELASILTSRGNVMLNRNVMRAHKDINIKLATVVKVSFAVSEENSSTSVQVLEESLNDLLVSMKSAREILMKS